MNQRTSLLVGFLLHSSVIFALQISRTGEQKQMRETEEEGGEDANLKQERDVLDVGLSLLLKKNIFPSLKKRFGNTSDHFDPLSIIS